MALWPFSLFSSTQSEKSSSKDDADQKRLEYLKAKARLLLIEMEKFSGGVQITPQEDSKSFVATISAPYIPEEGTNGLGGNDRYAEMQVRAGKAKVIFIANIDYAPGSNQPFKIVQLYPVLDEEEYSLGKYDSFEKHAVDVLRYYQAKLQHDSKNRKAA